MGGRGCVGVGVDGKEWYLIICSVLEIIAVVCLSAVKSLDVS